jgi:hypothetical protein
MSKVDSGIGSEVRFPKTGEFWIYDNKEVWEVVEVHYIRGAIINTVSLTIIRCDDSKVVVDDYKVSFKDWKKYWTFFKGPGRIKLNVRLPKNEL